MPRPVIDPHEQTLPAERTLYDNVDITVPIDIEGRDSQLPLGRGKCELVVSLGAEMETDAIAIDTYGRNRNKHDAIQAMVTIEIGESDA